MSLRRPRALGSAALAFLLAGAECEALLYGFAASFGQSLRSPLTFQELALPSVCLVAGAAAAAKFLLVTRRAAREAARATAWTEPVDLETLRERLATFQPVPTPASAEPETAKTRTRQILDERLARASGAAGSSRLR